MRLRTLVLSAVLLAGVAGRCSAGVIGFNGPWRPVDDSGNLINGFSTYITGPGQNLGIVLSPDKSTLTLTFNDPGDSDGSIFFENWTNLLPPGLVSYDWTFTLDSTSSIEFETGTVGVLAGTYSAGFTTSGSVLLNYPIPNFPTPGATYFSYGNMRFYSGDGPVSATAVLTNFEFQSVPEIDPAGMGSIFAMVGGGLGILERRRRRA